MPRDSDSSGSPEKSFFELLPAPYGTYHTLLCILSSPFMRVSRVFLHPVKSTLRAGTWFYLPMNPPVVHGASYNSCLLGDSIDLRGIPDVKANMVALPDNDCGVEGVRGSGCRGGQVVWVLEPLPLLPVATRLQNGSRVPRVTAPPVGKAMPGGSNWQLYDTTTCSQKQRGHPAWIFSVYFTLWQF